jgi:DNA-binding response OmpR family regulator
VDVDARLEALEAVNERLRDEITMLREAFLSDGVAMPLEWGLTGKEQRILGALLAREVCTKNQLMAALYDAGIDDEPQMKIIDVFVCKARKKLKPFGVLIDTVWGSGYKLSPQVKALAKAQISGMGIAA